MNQNRLKKYSSLAFGKYRKKYGLFLAEGRHLVEELLKSDWDIETIISSGDDNDKLIRKSRRKTEVEIVKQSVINKIATTKTAQDILAVVKIPESKSTLPPDLNRIVVADGIKDPGNMGTIIRTARAFYFDALIATASSVDIFNPKVARATQGAMFGVNLILNIDIVKIAGKLKRTHKFYALDPDGDTDIDYLKPSGKAVLMIGSETEGVSRPLLELADHRVRIPHSDSVESLNAAVACGIAMHRFGRISE